MSSIIIKVEHESIADYHRLRKWVIRDKIPKRKQGVSDYWIEAFMWYGKRTYAAEINCCWFVDTHLIFASFREASNWIKKMMY